MGSNEPPIHSAFDDDPAHAEAIDAFVVMLAERVDELQDLEQRGEWTRLIERAGALGHDAIQVGYPPLAHCAEDVARDARQGDGELVYKALIELTGLAQRVRRGHRGSL